MDKGFVKSKSEKVVSSKFKIYSFDVFDTVITRAVGSPQSLFLLLGQKMLESKVTDLSAEAFFYARVAAEASTYRNHGPQGPSTLFDIYLQLQFALGLSDKTTQEILEAEMALEKELIRGVPEMIRKIQAARQAGGRVIFISDTYFPLVFLKDVLRNEGVFLEGDGLYVSCEHRLSKHTGELFKKVLALEKISAGEMIHCGNDPVSDVLRPKQLGIRVAFFSEANLNRYENLMENFTFKTMGLSSLMAGASRRSRLGSVISKQNKASIQSVGAGVVAPILTSYVLWVLKQAKDQKLQRLYFVSRDGQMLLEIAKILKRKLRLSLDLKYLYGSRQAWNLPALTEFGENELRWMLDSSGGVTLISILMRVDIHPESIQHLLRKYGISKSDLCRRFDEKLKMKNEKLFEDQEMRQLILDQGNIKKPLLCEYLKQEGLFEEIPYGIVDLGWVGTMKNSFNKILTQYRKDLPPWFFFGDVKKNAHPQDFTHRAFMFSAPKNLGEIQCSRIIIHHLEAFCSGDHGAVLGYVAMPEGIKPILKEEKNTSVEVWGLSYLRESIRSFAEGLCIDEESACVVGCRELSAKLLEEFRVNPTKAEATDWGDFPFDYDQTGMHSFKMARRLSLKDVMDAFLFSKDKEGVFLLWPQACYRLTANYLVFLFRLAGLVHRCIGFLYAKIAHL